MAELVDVQDLGSCGAIRVGSTPTTRTIDWTLTMIGVQFFVQNHTISYFGMIYKPIAVLYNKNNIKKITIKARLYPVVATTG